MEESKSVSAGSSVIADKTKKPPRKSRSKAPKTDPPADDISAEISRKRGRSSRSKPNAESVSERIIRINSAYLSFRT